MKADYRDGFEAGLEIATNLLLLRASQIEQAVSPADLRASLLRDVAESTSALIHARETPANAEGLQEARDFIADEPGATGTTLCPVCEGRLDWIRFEDQSRGWCRTGGCISWLTS